MQGRCLHSDFTSTLPPRLKRTAAYCSKTFCQASARPQLPSSTWQCRQGRRHAPLHRHRSVCSVSACAAASSDGDASTAHAEALPANGTARPAAIAPVLPPTRIKAPGRVVAIGDIHGDLHKAVMSLEVAGVLTECDHQVKWTGGDTVVVQLGDVMDRGDSEIGVIMLLRELNRQAQLEGGRVLMLNGNHESLNVCGDFRYATPGGLRESALAAGLRDLPLHSHDKQMMARYMLYSPGGGMARELAKNPTVLLVNDTLFAHGGVLPAHVAYGLERMNMEVSAWMRGDLNAEGAKAKPPYNAIGSGANSVVWMRQFGQERFGSPYERLMTCTQLRATLDRVGAKQMVIGHTPQIGGANCECDCRVWRMDVGMSGGVLNATPQVLEITQEQGKSVVRIVTAARGPSVIPQASAAAAASS